ncbi:hypothetical protein AB9F45_26110 [Rhizobium leguminosarum]|uniref:hypothetical protein n=1 Tax=Rhizobium leguminosarum TaxID=384 RepID=UPI003F99C828
MTESLPKSVFFDEWPDEKERERFKAHNRAIFELFRHEQEQAHSGHMEYAKWLFASLLAIHGGAIYAVNGLRSSVPVDKSQFLIDGAALSLVGVFLTLLAGFFAWLNLLIAENLYRNLATPALLYRTDAMKDVPGNWVDRSMYASAAFGILSALAFAAAAIVVIFGLKHL